MVRIIASVRIANALHASKSLRCDALVDSNAHLMMLPAAWKHRFGELGSIGTIELGVANQRITKAEVCGPVLIQIEGFRPIHSEVAFVDLKPDVNDFEPLLGNIVLAQSQAAVDVPGNRLVPIRHMDLK